MRYLKLFFLCFLTFLIQGCPTTDDEILVGTLKIFNDSDETVYCGCPYISESEITSKNMDEYLVKEIKIVNNSHREYSYYENQFEGNYNKKIWILIYKQSTLDTHSWEEIQTENLYDKRYSFTLEELKAMNWTIVYDGE